MQKYSLQGKEYDGCIYLAVIYTIIFFSLAAWIIIDQPLIHLPLKLVLVLIPGIMIYMVVGSYKSFILVPIKKELLSFRESSVDSGVIWREELNFCPKCGIRIPFDLKEEMVHCPVCGITV